MESGDVLRSVVIWSLPQDTVVHSGHGDTTTIGEESGSLPEWSERGD